MEHSIGLFEFTSISDGLKITDLILKSSNVQIHKNELICPGKYVLLIKGDLKAVHNAIDRAKSEKLYSMKKAEVIANIAEEVFDAINKKVEYTQVDAMGVLETKNYVASLILADRMVKSSKITIHRIIDRLGIFGKGLVIYSGSTSEVNNAHNSALASSYKENIISSNTIHRPIYNFFNF